MNDLDQAYGYYTSIDKLLKSVYESKNKSIKRNSIKKGTYWDKVIELAKVHDFIILFQEGTKQKIAIKEAGINHLQNGGFKVYDLPIKEETPKNFKQILDDIAGLLTIFGILNAVTIFASQVNSASEKKVLSSDITGIQFISISMYLLSILVLWEIISTILKDAQDSFKFKALYFLLCTTTLGIAMLFFNQYEGFVYSIIGVLVFFGVIFLIYWGLFQIMTTRITKKNAKWFQKNSSKLITILLFLSMILGGIILKYALHLFLKK